MDPKICVVTLIGKSQLVHNQTKAWKLNFLIRRNYFQAGNANVQSKEPSPADASSSVKRNKENEKSNTFDDFSVQTYLDAKSRVLYVHVESIYDVNYMLDTLNKNDQLDENAKNFFELWEREQIRYIKSVLLLFSISHIVIVSNPSCEFDVGYIRFFRILDTFRNKMLPSVVELLKSLDLPISKEWTQAGRACSPRVLFTFENCPQDLLDREIQGRKSIEKLQHSLEDQIYNSLRKAYVITNISNNSLFAIPANQEFVYIHRIQTSQVNNNKFLLANLYKESLRSSKPIGNLTASAALPSSASLFSSSSPMTASTSATGGATTTAAERILRSEELDASLFRKFVGEHTKKALSEGFNDNIGRTNNVQAIFELPRASVWHKLFAALADFMLREPARSAKMRSHFAQLKSHVDIDAQFSQNRCKKIQPLAISIYQENLPTHYNKAQHEQRMDKAVHFYSIQARGPLFDKYLTRLKRECTEIWHRGRQLCEAVSLTGHNCVNEMHELPAPPPQLESASAAAQGDEDASPSTTTEDVEKEEGQQQQQQQQQQAAETAEEADVAEEDGEEEEDDGGGGDDDGNDNEGVEGREDDRDDEDDDDDEGEEERRLQRTAKRGVRKRGGVRDDELGEDEESQVAGGNKETEADDDESVVRFRGARKTQEQQQAQLSRLWGKQELAPATTPAARTSKMRSDRMRLPKQLRQQQQQQQRNSNNKSIRGGMSSRCMPVKCHTSNIVTRAASNCGEFQRDRKDPFDLKEANFTFYAEFPLASDQMLKRRPLDVCVYEFPVFKQTTPTAKPSSDVQQQQQQQERHTNNSVTQQSAAAGGGGGGGSTHLSQPDAPVQAMAQQPQHNQRSAAVTSRSEQLIGDINFPSPLNEPSAKLPNPLANTSASQLQLGGGGEEEDTIILKQQQAVSPPVAAPPQSELFAKSNEAAQTSSTEMYLSGMTHSESPLGLLPKFSSWSLVSIGEYADYNATLGLTQPGFLANYNYLIPWDVLVTKGTVLNMFNDKLSSKRTNEKLLAAAAAASNTDSLAASNTSVNMRIYIGMEYECPLGHRFVCSGPDRLVKVSNIGIVKDDAYKLINFDMPLYTACPCRNTKESTPYMAQMMRIYVVTPPAYHFYATKASSDDSLAAANQRANVSPSSTSKLQQLQQNSSTSTAAQSSNAPPRLKVLLRPWVQPNSPPCPIFFPSNNGPITLASNSIMVLRLPYIYAGDDQKPFYRPKDMDTLNNCRLLKGTFAAEFS